jgi:hypothetical protein
MPGRHDPPERDQGTTGFTFILENLIEALPGVAGAALVDELGECVDYAGVLEAYEIRLVSAHMQIELRNAMQGALAQVGRVRSLTICAHRRSYTALTLIEEYNLILVFTGGAPLSVSSRAIAQAEYDIRLEGGWEPPVDLERWIHLHVDARPHDKWRPHRVEFANAWHDVVVIGTVVGLVDGERGFRVRTGSGEEMTLVRERSGHWYADVRY